MKKSRSNKVTTEYRDNVTNTSPIYGRKYTITHSDVTGELFVTIGLEFAEDKINPTRDEVLLELTKLGNRSIFYGEVLVDGEGVKGNSKIRNSIFIREMPKALGAVRYGDIEFFEKYKELDLIPIYIKFNSSNSAYDKLHYFGNMDMYKNI